MIPCYVSGKGLHATDITWSFKTSVISMLESTGVGYDTRFSYYRKQFPKKSTEQLARIVCDPIEYYDIDWPEYRAMHKRSMAKEEMATRFMLERDLMFQRQAQVAIYCFDEAGFGSGVNVMRFIYANKPILGFLNEEKTLSTINTSNILQLKAEFPHLVQLVEYRTLKQINQEIERYLSHFQQQPMPKKMHLVAADQS